MGIRDGIIIAPEQFHIAIAGSDGVRVSYATMNSTSVTQCSYGFGPGNLNTTVTGTAKQYLPIYGYYHHTVKLSPLTPSTTYYYQCGDGTATGNTSSIYHFTTPAPEGNTDPFNMLIFGDWGYLDSVQRPMALKTGGLQGNWSASLTRTLMETLKPNLSSVWIVGDCHGYPDDSFGHVDEVLNFGYENVLNGWFNWIQNMSAYMYFHASVGNHESECHSPYCILNLETHGLPLSNFTAYNNRFSMPAEESNGVLNMWYSWDYGNVHFVSIDTETDFPGAPEDGHGDSGFSFLPAGYFAPNGTYLAWLEADLAAARANPNIKWILAGGHRPFEDFYSLPVTALFGKYNVDMYFAGHGHSYTRYNVSAYGDNTVHIMVGGAGCDEMPYPTDQFVPTVEELDEYKLFNNNGTASCYNWCTNPQVRQVYAGMAHTDHTVQHIIDTLDGAFDNKNEETASATTDNSNDDVPSDIDPCRYCANNPVYASDNMAIGYLQIQGNSLTWQLLRAPDGLVLDSITLRK